MSVVHGIENIVFGADSTEALPLKGFPAGRIRLRLRVDDFARVFIKTEEGTECYYIKQQNGYWVPACRSGRNQTLVPENEVKY